nr:MAG TPA: hypothetical protein [Caudoviricetes sp.]
MRYQTLVARTKVRARTRTLKKEFFLEYNYLYFR